MTAVKKEDCDAKHAELLGMFGEVRDAVLTHLGEHSGEDKAEAKKTSKVRRVGVYIAIAFGGVSLLGTAAMGCLKIYQVLTPGG